MHAYESFLELISVSVSVSKVRFSNKKWLDKIASAQRSHAVPDLRRLFNDTVFGWSTKPRMGWSQQKSVDEITLRIYPTGPGADIWNLLNAGSPAHQINPIAPNRFLWFRKGYRAATSPNVLRSQRKYRSGPYTAARAVNHPGFESRNFTTTIAQEYAENFAMEMQKAVTEAANSS